MVNDDHRLRQEPLKKHDALNATIFMEKNRGLDNSFYVDFDIFVYARQVFEEM